MPDRNSISNAMRILCEHAILVQVIEVFNHEHFQQLAYAHGVFYETECWYDRQNIAHRNCSNHGLFVFL